MVSPPSTACSCRHFRGLALSQPMGNHDGRTALAPAPHSTKYARPLGKKTPLHRIHTRREAPTRGLGHRTWRALQPQRSLFPPRTGPPCPLTHTGNHHLGTGSSLVRISCGRVTHLFCNKLGHRHLGSQQQRRWGRTSLATSSATPSRHPHELSLHPRRVAWTYALHIWRPASIKIVMCFAHVETHQYKI